MQEMALAWEEYSRLERSVEHLRAVLQAHMTHSATPQVRRGTAASVRTASVFMDDTTYDRNVCVCVTPQQEKSEMKRELWRIEDVMAGLSASKANYRVTIDSIQNPGRSAQ